MASLASSRRQLSCPPSTLPAHLPLVEGMRGLKAADLSAPRLLVVSRCLFPYFARHPPAVPPEMSGFPAFPAYRAFISAALGWCRCPQLCSPVTTRSLAVGQAAAFAASILKARFSASFSVQAPPISKYSFTSRSRIPSMKAWAASSEYGWWEAKQGPGAPTVRRPQRTPAVSHHPSASWP
jgi:hypothetical protein